MDGAWHGKEEKEEEDGDERNGSPHIYVRRFMIHNRPQMNFMATRMHSVPGLYAVVLH